MASCEMEAAEALAGLSRSSAASRGGTPSLRPNFHVSKKWSLSHHTLRCANTTTTMVTPSSVKNDQSNWITKSSGRSVLTEAEKEERRVRRIIANRESARQAIRRKQAMYLELRSKAADVLEENKNLKKEKELALKEYAAIKERNEFLKAQMAKIKKSGSGETQEQPKKSDNTTTAGTCSISSSHGQPWIWPSALQTHDALLHFNATGSTQTQWNTSSCLHNQGSGIPLFLIPVPWLLPFLSQSRDSAVRTTHLHQHSVCSSDNDPCCRDRTNQLQGYEDSAKTLHGFNSNPKSSVGSPKAFQTPDLNVVPAIKIGGHRLSLPEKSREVDTRSEKRLDQSHVAAAEARRRRRKELMKMKDMI